MGNRRSHLDHLRRKMVISDNRQQTTDNGQRTTDNGQQTTDYRLQIVVSWYRFTESLVDNFSKKDVFLWKILKK